MRKKKTQPADEPELIAFEDFKPKTLEEAVQRLRDLAEFLVFGKLGHSEFNFAVVNEGGNHGNRCGFIGCAIGELPIRFPQYWWFMPGGVSERTGGPEFVPIGNGSSYAATATPGWPPNASSSTSRSRSAALDRHRWTLWPRCTSNC
jgi:hypothetical protein